MVIQRKTNVEKEVKFKINPKLTKSQLENFLKEQGLVAKERILQKDVYWDNQACDIINLKRGLRVRYVSNQVKDVEFKSLFKRENGQYVIEEIKLLKNGQFDISALKEILINRLGICELKGFDNNNLDSPEVYLSKLGLSPVITLEKERSVWVDQNGEIEVSVDIVSGLGIFVEVEQVGNSNQVYDKIVKRFRKSNFATQDFTHSGYLDLILNKNNKITPKAGFKKKFEDNNKWNVRTGEQDIFLSLTQFNE